MLPENGPFPAASAPVGNPLEPAPPATAELRVWRMVYRRQRDLDRFPDVDPARLPLSVYSHSDRDSHRAPVGAH